RAKPFGRLPFHPSMIQRSRKHAGPQFREEAGDVHATLVGYLNRDIKKINRLSSAVSAQKYIQDKHFDKRFSVLEQDLDDNVATPDNVVVFDKKKNTIYSVDGYTTAVRFGDPEHLHKRNRKKQYYSDDNDLERAALAAKLKTSGIKCGPYMKWLSMTKPHKVKEIKNYSFRAFTADVKKIINTYGSAKLPMATKQQIMASAWNSVLIISAVEILERQDVKKQYYTLDLVEDTRYLIFKLLNVINLEPIGKYYIPTIDLDRNWGTDVILYKLSRCHAVTLTPKLLQRGLGGIKYDIVFLPVPSQGLCSGILPPLRYVTE
ncbi:MAG: hypothetical protein EZS28_024657, partial [Streblomastix strix]